MSRDRHMSILVLKIDIHTLQVRLIDTLCYILVILGIVGNVLGLIIFSSSCRARRISSVYVCLATCSSITNLLCVIRYTSILHSISRQILRHLIGHNWWACKLYEFSFSFRVISSWIILFWMFERLMCVSRSLRAFFHRWHSSNLKFIIPISLSILILSGIMGPPVYMYQPTIILDNDTISIINTTKWHCEVNPNASVKWQKYFHEIHLGMNYFTIRCVFSELIPTGAIILFNSYIVHHLIHTYRHLHRTSGHKPRKEQSRTTSWMNIVLVLHSSLFLASLFSHILGHFIVVEAHETWWVLLAVLINCSLNFYIYCLSGKAFRNEIRRLFHRRQTHQQQSFQNQRLMYQRNTFQGLVHR